MKKLLLVTLIITMVLSISLGLVACKDKEEANSGNEQTPEYAKFDTTKEYTTKNVTFWVGVGKGYMTLKDGKFDVYVSVSSGDFESWLQGDYTYDSNEDALLLTATWTEDENQTKLTNATSGVAKTYKFSKGACKISVDLPSAGAQVFTVKVE